MYEYRFSPSGTKSITSEAKLQAITTDLHLYMELPPSNEETKALAFMEELAFASSKRTT